jgi:hypothetical protein
LPYILRSTMALSLTRGGVAQNGSTMLPGVKLRAILEQKYGKVR